MDNANTNTAPAQVNQPPPPEEAPAGLVAAAAVANVTPARAMKIRDKILHVLKVWPGINPSMLNCGIGIQVPSRQWRPIFEWLTREGKIKCKTLHATNPTGQSHAYDKIFVAEDLADELPAEIPAAARGESTLRVA